MDVHFCIVADPVAILSKLIMQCNRVPRHRSSFPRTGGTRGEMVVYSKAQRISATRPNAGVASETFGVAEQSLYRGSGDRTHGCGSSSSESSTSISGSVRLASLPSVESVPSKSRVDGCFSTSSFRIPAANDAVASASWRATARVCRSSTHLDTGGYTHNAAPNAVMPTNTQRYRYT